MEQPQTTQTTQQPTIEQQVASEILQRPMEVRVAGKTYSYAPPSTATLILASEAISRLPQVKLSSNHMVEDSLFAAKDCQALGDVAAIMLLGAKNLTETVKTEREVEERRLFGLIRRRRTITEERTVDRKAELAKTLLEDIPPRELWEIIADLLKRMQLGDFFGVTTFLIGVNLLKAKREVETETTASGQSSLAQ